MKYDETTPMRLIKVTPKRLQKNVAAFTTLLSYFNGKPVDWIYEGMAGTGNQTRVLHEKIKPVYGHFAYDTDVECCKILKDLNLPVVVVAEEFPYAYKARMLPCRSLLSLDINNHTILHTEKYAECFRLLPKWLVLTDIAKTKLHLHYKRYGLPKSEIHLYVAAVVAKINMVVGGEYRLVNFVSGGGGITYILMELTKD